MTPTLPPTFIETVHVIYPEDVHVPESIVLGWAHDALVNAAVDDYVKANGPISTDADGDQIYESIASRQPRPTDIDEAMALLSDLGSHTFERRAS